MKLNKSWQWGLLLPPTLALIYALRRWGEGESPAAALTTVLLFGLLLLVLMGVTKYWPQIQSRWPRLARWPAALAFGWIFLLQLLLHRQESWQKMLVGGAVAALLGCWVTLALLRRFRSGAAPEKTGQ